LINLVTFFLLKERK